MKTPEQIAREVVGEDALAGVGYDKYLPWIIKGIEADRAQREMGRGHAPVETVMTKAEVETREGLKMLSHAIDMIFIGGEK